MGMLRSIRELLQPSLKCERTGEHDMRHQTRKFWRYPPKEYHSVADKCTEERDACRRCNHATEWEITKTRGSQSLSMPSYMWEQLEETGRVDL